MKNSDPDHFVRLSSSASFWAGHPAVFWISFALIILWAIFGFHFDFSTMWIHVINTGTAIVTFLMVFLLQNTQNRDSAAVQAKLDELIRVSEARNSLIGIESLSHNELQEIKDNNPAASEPPIEQNSIYKVEPDGS